MKPYPSLFAALLSLGAGSAFARETPPLASAKPPTPIQSPPASEQPPSAQSHAASARHGFYLHGEFGAGYRTIAFSGQDLRATGAGLGSSVLIGGSLAQNLFLVGELSMNNIINPTIQVAGQSAQARDTRALFVAAGPGIIYYVMPANVSLGASLLLSQASLIRDEVKVGESEPGYGGCVRAGKEWWVGERSGLGLSAAIALASMKDKGSSSRLVTAAYTLSAAYTY